MRIAWAVPGAVQLHAMHIGVLTHNYPRFGGDFSGTFVEALCDELARQGHQVTIWAPYDQAYARPLTYTPSSNDAGLSLSR